MKGSEKQLARAFIDSTDGSSVAQVQEFAVQLVELLVSRNEVNRVRGVIEAIENAWKERYGTGTITIETAYPLSVELREKLLSLAHGAELKEKVRPEIIGGARLRIDETIIDGSIEGHLTNLNHAFRNA